MGVLELKIYSILMEEENLRTILILASKFNTSILKRTMDILNIRAMTKHSRKDNRQSKYSRYYNRIQTTKGQSTTPSKTTILEFSFS